MAEIDNTKNTEVVMTTENLNLLVGKINDLITFTSKAEARLFDPDMIIGMPDDKLEERYQMAFDALYKLLEYLRRVLAGNMTAELSGIASALLNLPADKLQRVQKLLNEKETDTGVDIQGDDININL